jgi:ECF transporter S component (folate family)
MQTPEYLPVFSARYWRAACREVTDLRRLVLAAVVCALSITISSVFIPVGSNLRIYFTFLVTSLGATVYGPVLGVMVGFVSDILGFVIHPSGAFFPGYTLSAMLGGLCYGLLLYRHRVSVVRILAAKVVINYGVNVLLGSLWSAMLYSKGYYYYFASSIVKNTLLLPLEVLVLVALFNLVLPQLARMRVIPPLPSDRRTIPLR